MLLHGGSGGFDGDGAIRGTAMGISRESTMGLVVFAHWDVICPAKHPDVITGAIVVLVLGIRWSGINTGGVGGEGKISIGKIGELWIGINLVEGLATTGYFS